MDLNLDLLVLKVAIAPTFILIVSLIALRYGHGAAGWLVALPINTGTIILVLTLSEGTAFAATAALGALLGIVSICVFAIAYTRSALYYRWPICLALGVGGFALSTAVLSQFPEVVALGVVAVVVSILVVLATTPKGRESEQPPVPPRWEIPMRMLTAALLVVVITTIAESVGPQLSGLLSPIPVFTITLVIFTHSRLGPAPVFVFLRGAEYGLFSFAAFCAIVAVLLVPYGLAVAIAAGLAGFLAVYALIRLILRRTAGSSPFGLDAEV